MSATSEVLRVLHVELANSRVKADKAMKDFYEEVRRHHSKPANVVDPAHVLAKQKCWWPWQVDAELELIDSGNHEDCDIDDRALQKRKTELAALKAQLLSGSLVADTLLYIAQLDGE